MNITIRKYQPEDYQKLHELIVSEGEEWKEYLLPKYQLNLEQSITYVAFSDEVLCGYSRSMNDPGYFVWIIDLLVHKNYRGHSIGKQLMECVQSEFPEQDIYVMSDADEYYKKLGFKIEGTIFKVK